MLIHIKGTDSFLAKEAINAIKKRYQQKYAQAMELIEADEQSGYIWENLLATPFFEPTRLVIIRRAGLLPKDDQLRLANVITKLPSTTIAVFALTGAEKSLHQPLLKALNKADKIIEAVTPRGPALKKWISQRARLYGCRLEQEVLDSLAESWPNDLWAIDNYLKNYALGHQDKITGKEQLVNFVLYNDIIKNDFNKLSADILRLARLNEPIEKILGALDGALRKYPTCPNKRYLVELISDLDLALKTGLIDRKGAFALLSFYSSQNREDRIKWKEIWLNREV